MKICPKAENIPKPITKFCLMQNKPSNKDQRLLTCCQNGEISPNLLTLLTAQGAAYRCSELSEIQLGHYGAPK